jgi:GNAT superfamily N-acetyltransferase
MIIRKATENDLSSIVKLLANDPLGMKRECYQDPLPESYRCAFSEINVDKNNFLAVVEEDNKIIGTLQLTFITYLTYQGGKRALIEGVRIDESYRGKGLGKKLFEWAIEKSREEKCHVVQLTTDKSRPEALEFYMKLGFSASHEGLKLHL